MSHSLFRCILLLRLVITQNNVASGFARGSLSQGMQSLEKRNQGSRLRRTQVFSVSRHVSTTLDNLPDQLILCESHRNRIKRGPSLAAEIPKRMAIAALFCLKNQRALPLQGGRAVQKLVWHRVAAPCVHVRTPRRVSSEMGERPQDYGNQQNR